MTELAGHGVHRLFFISAAGGRLRKNEGQATPTSGTVEALVAAVFACRGLCGREAPQALRAKICVDFIENVPTTQQRTTLGATVELQW